MTEIRDRRHAAWFWIDKDVIDRYGPQIGAYGVAVYTLLARYADNKGQAHPSFTTMAKQLGISKSTILRCLETLREVGMIEKTSRTSEHGDANSNIYTLLHIGGGIPQTPPGIPQTPPGIPQTLGVVSHRYQGGVSQTPPTPPSGGFLTRSTEQELEEQETPPSPSAGGAVADSSFSAASEKTRHTDYSPTFERWWQTYPAHRRIDKKACYKTWGSKHLEARTEEIIANTAAMKHTKQWQEGKIPNTTTYLNQERYETPATDGSQSGEMSAELRAELEEIHRQFLAEEAARDARRV